VNNSKETFYKVFGLIIVALLPTLFLYLLLREFISGSQLEGEFLGTTVTFTGPLAFYAFLILSFRKWAVTPFQKTWQSEIVAQKEIELMSEYDKVRAIHEIKGEISVLNQQLNYLNAALTNDQALEMPEIKQAMVDQSEVHDFEDYNS
jgi:hypothetical protein